MRGRRRQQQPSPWAWEIAERVGGVIVAAFDESGQVITAERYGEVLAALRTTMERTLNARQTLAVEERAAARAAWARTQQVYPQAELPARLDLSIQECRTAEELGYVVAVDVPYAVRDIAATFTRELHAGLLPRRGPAQRRGTGGDCRPALADAQSSGRAVGRQRRDLRPAAQAGRARARRAPAGEHEPQRLAVQSLPPRGRRCLSLRHGRGWPLVGRRRRAAGYLDIWI